MDTTVMRCCSSFWGKFEVPASSIKNHLYIVAIWGNEDTAECTCLSFKHSKGQPCKHIRYVMNKGCFWDEQSGTSGPAELKPFETYLQNDASEPCPNCGEASIFEVVRV